METLRMPLEVAFAKLTYGGSTGIIQTTIPVAAATTVSAKIPVQSVAPQAPKTIIKAESLQEIEAHWNELTHEVSRRKMALATYLQEGTPCEFKAGRLVIGFSKEHTFARECLNTKENIKFLDELFSEKLNSPVNVNFKTIEKAHATVKQEEPVVRSALEMFGGKVVKEWPNAQK